MLYQGNGYHKEIKASTDVMNLHERSLSFFKRNILTAIPLQKFDFATIPAHPFGGSGTPGAIQYKKPVCFWIVVLQIQKNWER
jgi:hypothetical protein